MRLSTTLTLLLITSVAALHTGCHTLAKQEVWPTQEVLPKTPPSDLDKTAQASVLRRGSDGFLYLVGGLDADAKPGTEFLARYSGEWPLNDLPRPPLAAGQIVKRYGNHVALVNILYAFPNTALNTLEVTWHGKLGKEDIGKGIARVVRAKPDEQSDVDISLGKSPGLRPGDIYAIVGAPTTDGATNEVHLGRRLRGICLVHTIKDTTSTCKLWRQSALHPAPKAPQEGDLAIFLEHTYGAPPRQAIIEFSKIRGDRANTLQTFFITQMTKYLMTHGASNTSVKASNLEVDPTSTQFHKTAHKIDSKGLPHTFVGLNLVTVMGKEHLMLNYTGVGPSSGPGMITAPPEGGVDLGRFEDLSGKDLRQLFGVLWSSILVYRGQTSEALIHLRQVLSDPELQGPLRWHARDQYAMQFAALGYVDDALWLVTQDEYIAKMRKDRRAELNALGTRIRLYDLLNQPKAALKTSRRYLELRKREGKAEHILQAHAMLAEMLMNAKRMDEARKHMEIMVQSCPTGCDGDLFVNMMAIFWSVPTTDDTLRQDLLKQIAPLAKKGDERARVSLHIQQGLQALRQRLFEQALLAFSDAEKLYKNQHSAPGMARAKYFSFMAHLAMKEPVRAHEKAIEVINIAKSLRDYTMETRMYESLSNVYVSLSQEAMPSTGTIKRAISVLSGVFESHISNGDMGKASHTMLTIGSFFFRLGNAEDAQEILQKTVIYSIRTTRFATAARAHLLLAFIALKKNDMDVFKDEIRRAQTMAKLSKEPSILEEIKRALEPKKKPESKIDSRIL